MNKLTAYHYLVTLFLVLVLTVSCSQQDDTCRESRNVKLNATFYVDSINPDNRYVTEKFTVDSLTVQGVGKDSLIYNKKSTMYMELPLQIFAEESRFSLIINTISDTITIRYKNFLEFYPLSVAAFVHTPLIRFFLPITLLIVFPFSNKK